MRGRGPRSPGGPVVHLSHWTSAILAPAISLWRPIELRAALVGWECVRSMPHLSLLGLPEAQVMRELEDLHGQDCEGSSMLHKHQDKFALLV